MRNKISAIIIDPHKSEHDYSKVKSIQFITNAETSFDFLIKENLDGIKEDFNNFKGFDCLITIGSDGDFSIVNEMDFEIRRKWVHLNEFNEGQISNIIFDVFLFNINRERPIGNKKFSVFTCAFNTPFKVLDRLYNSLKAQTYQDWDWFILDDSTTSGVETRIKKYNDYRITVFKNVTNHGSIGFNKHMIASMCDGDYLVEIDHDDELTPDCFEMLHNAFVKFPESDFVYSDAIELVRNEPIVYGEGWGFGYGKTRSEVVGDRKYTFSETPLVNAVTIRTIYAQPNHVRCWKKDFYHKIGGHNTELSVLDDMDILIRTFIYGKMTKVKKVLYFQHEGDNERTNGDTTQGKRFNEIQRTVWLLLEKYDKDIHKRVIELGGNDPVWNEEEQACHMDVSHDISKTINLCNVYENTDNMLNS